MTQSPSDLRADGGEPPAEVTRLLNAWRSGDDEAHASLFPLIYEELRRVARRHMSGEGPGATLQATALVNEAYLRLVKMDVDWQDRGHFFAVAANAMRRILVDRARQRRADKRGGGIRPVSLEDVDVAAQSPAVILALDEALRALAAIDERKAKVVELRYFAGLTIAETAKVFGVSHTTIEKDMKLAKAWIQRYMDDGETA